ncbi:MAG: hypothetical protein HYY50_00345 [Candidatus Kerfeldbacteria bacterium]|nr:hypothetical protein [Candidatus Kerfeldbacteria bacterium]
MTLPVTTKTKVTSTLTPVIILTTAGSLLELQTVGVAMLMAVSALFILLLAPAPSLFGLIWLFSAVLMVIRAAQGFFAWQAGLR